MLDAQMYCV